MSELYGSVEIKNPENLEKAPYNVVLRYHNEKSWEDYKKDVQRYKRIIEEMMSEQTIPPVGFNNRDNEKPPSDTYEVEEET